MRLRGTVAHVADNGQLRVHHVPIFKMPFSKYLGKRNLNNTVGQFLYP